MRNRRHFRKFSPFQKKDPLYPQIIKFNENHIEKSKGFTKEKVKTTKPNVGFTPEGDIKSNPPNIIPAEGVTFGEGTVPLSNDITFQQQSETSTGNAQENVSDVPNPKKLSLALRRLQSHNKPGRLE